MVIQRWLAIFVFAALSCTAAFAQPVPTPPPDVLYYSNLMPGTAYPIAVTLPRIGRGTIIASINGTALVNGGTIFSSTGSWSLEAGNFTVGINPKGGGGLHFWDTVANLQASPVLPLIAGKTVTVAATQNGYHLSMYVCSPTCVKTFVPDAGALGVGTAANIGGSGNGIRVCVKCHIWGVRVSSSLSDDQIQKYALSAIDDPYPSSTPTPSPTIAPTAPPTAVPTPTPTNTPKASALWFTQWHGNQTVGSNPALASNSNAIINTLYANGGKHLTFPGARDGVPSFWTAKSSDPQVQINVQEPTGIGRVASRWYIPTGAYPAPNSDHHISVLQPDGMTIFECWEFNGGNAYNGGGSVSCTSAAAIRLDSTGFNTNGGWPAMAAGSSTRLGYSSVAELSTGVIPHALEATPACAEDSTIVGQATAPLGQQCGSQSGPGVRAGQYLWSDVTPSQLPPIGSNGMNKATYMVCVALNQYGALVGDTNGNWNSISINGLGSSIGTDSGAYNAWTSANMSGGSTNPGACFPNGWKSHFHVLERT
jgi:hypothetical protein